ncbi:MAG: PIN domain-containing protein [Nanoarchaeota archaeon]|nr:PIN domain-containing protein [Nanoarchaeota archaeon]
MLKIILDTNFLLIPFTVNVDIFRELERIIDEPYEVIVLEKSLDELENITKTGNGKEKLAAKLAFQLIKKKGVKVISFPHEKQKSLYTPANSQKHIIVDDLILAFADEKTIVATQDKGLKKRLKDKGIRQIILRKKQYLERI